MRRRFENMVVITTGASQGIGRAAAELFASEGAHVVLCARKQPALDEAVAAIVKTGGHASGFAINAGDEDAMVELVRSTVAQHGLMLKRLYWQRARTKR